MLAERSGLWAIAIHEATRLGVRVKPTMHTFCDMDRRDARLMFHERGGGYVLLIWGGLDPNEAATAALLALAAISPLAWKACSQKRGVGT